MANQIIGVVIFFELINILDDLKSKNYIDGINAFYYLSSTSRFAWISNVFDEMIDESQEKAKDFFKILVRHKSIKSSIFFWIIFLNTHFKKRGLRFLLLKSFIFQCNFILNYGISEILVR